MMDRKSTWRVACETCRKNGKRFHCTWRFHGERGAQARIERIRETEKKNWRISTSNYVAGSLLCLEKTHDLLLEHWDGERWVKQE